MDSGHVDMDSKGGKLLRLAFRAREGVAGVLG
jgi:hypothetical protein